MKKNRLGKTDILVTELTLGTLTLGPLQADLSSAEAKKLILKALEMGINSIDTAEMYQVDGPIKAALQEFGDEVILATKSTALSYDDMEKSVLGAMRSLGRDYLDIFYLHAAYVTPEVFAERSGALECLLRYKQKGYIRAVGISTHVVPVVEKAADLDEIDVVFPLINKSGLGIVGGTTEDMIKAIEKASCQDKGIMAMKILGGGNLLGDIQEAVAFVRGIPGINSAAVGMKNLEELDINVRLFRDQEVTQEELSKIQSDKQLFISRICVGCGVCVEKCPNQALSVLDGKATVDRQKCILCGYCYSYCPNFAIRMV